MVMFNTHTCTDTQTHRHTKELMEVLKVRVYVSPGADQTDADLKVIGSFYFLQIYKLLCSDWQLLYDGHTAKDKLTALCACVCVCVCAEDTHTQTEMNLTNMT